MKKIIALLLALVLVLSLAACGGNEAKPTDAPVAGNDTPATDAPEAPAEPEKITLKVWAPQEDQVDENSWLIQVQAAFQAAHPEYIITWENGVCPEGDAKQLVTADPTAAADVYMYANDHLGSLIQAGAVAKLGGPYLEQVMNDNSEAFIGTVTYADGGVYGFPIAPNTWFMYYNKSILNEEDVKSLEACLEKGIVTFDVANSWNLPAFFFAAGGSLFGELGVDAAAGAQFGGQAGYDATEALLTLAENPNFKWDGDGYGNNSLKDGTVAAYFSGDWDYKGLYAALGENLGACAAPTVMIGGEAKQLLPYSGSKAVGVNPHAKNMKAAMQFAAYLASVESQKLRFELREIVPAATELHELDAIKNSIVAQAILDTMNGKSAFQPKIPEMDPVWTPVGTFGSNIKDGVITKDNIKESVDALDAQLNGGGL